MNTPYGARFRGTVIAAWVGVLAGASLSLTACSSTVGVAPLHPTTSPVVPVTVALRQDLQTYLDEHKTGEHISAASLSVSLADASSLDVAAGTTQYGGGAPVTKADLFQIGSNTKAFTAVVVLKLEAEHRLTLDQTIGDWLAQYPTWKAATIRRLLDMTGGIATYDATPAWEHAYGINPYRFTPASTLIGYVDPDAPLKKGWNYSNTGYLLNQLIVEKAAGRSFTQLLRHDVLDATHIRDLYYYSGIYPKALRARTVAGYFDNEGSSDEGLAPLLKTDVRGYSLSWAQAAGGIVATPHAVTLWARDLYQGTIVTPAQRRELESLVSTATGKPIAHVTKQDPRGFGLGVSQLLMPGLGRFWFYEGETLGYRMLHAYFPAQNVVIAIGLNSQPSGQDHIGDLVKSVVATLTAYGLF